MRMFSTKSIAAAVCAAAMVFITGRAAATKDHEADINANGVAFSVFKIDKPLDGPGGGVLANFTRVQTFGATRTGCRRASTLPTRISSSSSRAWSRRTRRRRAPAIRRRREC